MNSWLPVVACVSLLFFILTWKRPEGSEDRASLARVALLCGIRPLWGESDESLRERSSAASRWPFSAPKPRFVWWARAARRIVQRR